ncbi:hypothetical protein [Rubripirellula reticaptiva]|uniref:Uncharacterized protein n=1 Tax=Rubripirellula reticaptiva TaxID=2528013 RepID=A0A5C6FFB0_9BACT|nr:hypothetical protein [Rubripirellula reticaptiva]TWU58319.1 hypothetical protein Poly59_12300 [Rubripirellula reticaptiva]
MWHTSRGDRTLRGAESALVGAAIDTMIDALLVHVDVDCVDEVIPDCDSGIDVFDQLTVCQRIGLLHEVAEHLLTETDSPMQLSALAEATVAAIFVEVRDQIAIEIDLFGDSVPPQTEWRSLTLAAYQSMPESVSVDLPGRDSIDLTAFEDVVDLLSIAILWDRDFEMAESFLDSDPGVSQKRRKILGIDQDYFTSVAPDPRPEETFSLVSRTREIVRSKPR